MAVFEMVVVIVAIVMIAQFGREWLKSREGPGLDTLAALEERMARLESLEERIRVLEHLATDKSERLKREIDSL